MSDIAAGLAELCPDGTSAKNFGIALFRSELWTQKQPGTVRKLRIEEYGEVADVCESSCISLIGSSGRAIPMSLPTGYSRAGWRKAPRRHFLSMMARTVRNLPRAQTIKGRGDLPDGHHVVRRRHTTRLLPACCTLTKF